LGVCALTIRRWRERYVDGGTTGLTDMVRSGRPKHIDQTKVVQMISHHQSPELMTIRSLAKTAQVSPTTIRRIVLKRQIMLNRPTGDSYTKPAMVFDGRHINAYRSKRVRLLVIATGTKPYDFSEVPNASHKEREEAIYGFKSLPHSRVEVDARRDNRTAQEEGLILKRLLCSVEDGASIHSTFTMLILNINGPLHMVISEWTSKRPNWKVSVVTSNKAWTQGTESRLETVI